jgi:hypothetical protein
MAVSLRARSPLILCLTLLAGCGTVTGGASLQQEPLKAGSDWDHARLVDNSPSAIARDPVVARLTPLVKQDPEGNLPALVDALVAGRTDDFERVRAIHDWITKNIAYDFPAFRGNAPLIVEPYAVIRHGSSICDGYAHLFTLMCTMAGIRSQVVVGYGRGYGYDPFTEDSQPYKANHAWNAVIVNGGWYLVDTTWDAGGGDAAAAFTFKWQYSTGFLFTPPEVFLCTHFPDDPRWQLVDQPLDLAQLRSEPVLWGDFGTLGLARAGSIQRVSDVGEEQEILLRVPPHIRVAGFLSQGNTTLGGFENLVGQKRDGDQVSLKIMFPRPGRYALALNAFKEGDDASPIMLGELYFTAAGGSQKRSALMYPGAHESGLTMEAEYEYLFRVGSTVSIPFTYDGELLILLQNQARKAFQNRASVVREGKQQVATISFPEPGEYVVTLAAKSKSDPGRWTGVASLSYTSHAGEDLEFPFVTAKAREMGAALDGQQGYNPKVAGAAQFSIRLRAPIIVSVMDGERKTLPGRAFVVSDGDLKTVMVSFPGAGSYTVWVSASSPGKPNSWEGIVSLHYEASAAGRVFPTVYTGVEQQGYQVLAPLDGELRAGVDVSFEVSGPAAGVVFVQVGKRNVPLRGDAGHFKGIVHPVAGVLHVFGGLSSDKLVGIAQYQVR